MRRISKPSWQEVSSSAAAAAAQMSWSQLATIPRFSNKRSATAKHSSVQVVVSSGAGVALLRPLPPPPPRIRVRCSGSPVMVVVAETALARARMAKATVVEMNFMVWRVVRGGGVVFEVLWKIYALENYEMGMDDRSQDINLAKSLLKRKTIVPRQYWL